MCEIVCGGRFFLPSVYCSDEAVNSPVIINSLLSVTVIIECVSYFVAGMNFGFIKCWAVVNLYRFISGKLK